MCLFGEEFERKFISLFCYLLEGSYNISLSPRKMVKVLLVLTQASKLDAEAPEGSAGWLKNSCFNV
jgi:hypothetical protein